ncbi:MAG: AAA family ATPase, partial [Caldilineaceae bacterium]
MSHEPRRYDQSRDFVGRRTELADLVGLLGDPRCRLITLVGVGGVGKTRLGLRAAEEVRSQFVDGDCPVMLQPVETRSR